MATHSSVLDWRIPWTEQPVGYSLWRCNESDMTEQVTLSLSFFSLIASLSSSPLSPLLPEVIHPVNISLLQTRTLSFREVENLSRGYSANGSGSGSQSTVQS